MMEEYCDGEQLIELVKMRPALYDHTLRDHSNKLVIDELWNEIAAIMNCSVADCRSKWANLRCAYGRHLRQERGTPFSVRSKRRKTWYMANAMSFLEKHMALNRQVNKNRLYADNLNNFSMSAYMQQPNYFQVLESPGNGSYEGVGYPKQEPAISISEEESSSANFSANECSSSISATSPNPSTSTKAPTEPESVSGSRFESVSDRPIKSLPQLSDRAIKPPTPSSSSEVVSGSRFGVVCDHEEPQDADSMFFKSLLFDYKQLSKKSKRHFREQMVITLNKLQEEEEREELRSHVKLEYV